MVDCYEFDCATCKTHVYAYGPIPVPPPSDCSVCAWINEFIPAAEQPGFRARLGIEIEETPNAR